MPKQAGASPGGKKAAPSAAKLFRAAKEASMKADTAQAVSLFYQVVAHVDAASSPSAALKHARFESWLSLGQLLAKQDAEQAASLFCSALCYLAQSSTFNIFFLTQLSSADSKAFHASLAAIASHAASWPPEQFSSWKAQLIKLISMAEDCAPSLAILRFALDAVTSLPPPLFRLRASSLMARATLEYDPAASCSIIETLAAATHASSTNSDDDDVGLMSNILTLLAFVAGDDVRMSYMLREYDSVLSAPIRDFATAWLSRDWARLRAADVISMTWRPKHGHAEAVLAAAAASSAVSRLGAWS